MLVSEREVSSSCNILDPLEVAVLTLQSPVRGIFLLLQLDQLCLQALSEVVLCLDKRNVSVTIPSATRPGVWSGMCKADSELCLKTKQPGQIYIVHGTHHRFFCSAPQNNDKHLHQLSVFHMRCLRRICGISLLDHITNSVILKRCETFPVESQLRSKRLRWFGHICRMADSKLPRLLMYGQLVGQNFRGRPRTVWNDVVVFDIHNLQLTLYTHDALNKPVWRELTCVART